MTLRLDEDGIIREVTFANSVSGEGVDEWIGRAWSDTVGGYGGDKILRMIAEAHTNGVSDFSQVSQRFPSGRELPMEYNAVRLGGKSGLIAIGKNLQAVASVQSKLIAVQHAREEDSWKLRAVETRFRMLLDSSEEPVLLLRMDDLRIIDANAAAIHAGAFDAGRDFTAALAVPDRAAFHTMMARVAEDGRAPGIVLHFGASSAPWLVRGSITAAEPQTVFLLQLAPVAPLHSPPPETTALDILIDRLPDGFVLVDAAGTVVQANRAFLDLVQTATQAAAAGQPIGRWLSRPGADAAILIAAVKRHGRVRSFATLIQGEFGTEAKVEISAVGDTDEASGHIVLLIRDVSRRLAEIASSASPDAPSEDRLLAAIAKLTEKIGAMPLLELVRDTGGLIERHCIEGALDRVKGNRTAAAELLGLSRQSLYAKLSRYGMGSHEESLAAGD